VIERTGKFYPQRSGHAASLSGACYDARPDPIEVFDPIEVLSKAIKLEALVA
jgi:hypothetical protein